MVIPMYEMQIEKAMFAEHLGEVNQAIILYKGAMKYKQSGPIKKVEVKRRITNLVETLNKKCKEWHETNQRSENSQSIY